MPIEDNVLYAEERHERISELLKTRKKISVTALCQLFSVTPATVRVDLKIMQEQGLLTRTHGGAIARTRTAHEPRSAERSTLGIETKRRIALAALELIEDGDTLILDTGSTTLELARCLSSRSRLKIITNDLEIARLLEETGTGDVFLLGGTLRKGFHCTVNFSGSYGPCSFSVDKAFMGTNGFSTEKGATTPDAQQAEAKRALMAMSNQVILLCDSSKFGRVAFARFARIEDVHTLVTDALDSQMSLKLTKSGVEVILAKDTGSSNCSGLENS